MKEDFNMPAPRFGSNTYSDGTFNLTINAYDAWTQNEMNGARSTGSREVIPYPTKEEFKKKWTLLNKFTHSFIHYFPFYPSKEDAFKACKEFFVKYCQWDESARTVRQNHVDKCIANMRALCLRSCFMDHINHLKDKQVHSTLRGPFGGKTFIEEEKALNVFSCMMKHLAPETLPKSDEKDSLASVKEWLKYPSTGKSAKTAYKWLHEMEIVQTSNRILKIRQALLRRNPIQMDCLMYLHHRKLDDAKAQEEERRQAKRQKVELARKTAIEKEAAKRQQYWIDYWAGEDDTFHNHVYKADREPCYRHCQAWHYQKTLRVGS